MMKNISIKNYKILKNITINSLSKVNLIVGKNNSGKSTLLEAISIYAAGGSLDQLITVLANRDVHKPKHPHPFFLNYFSMLYSDMDKDSFHNDPIEISISSENMENTVSIKTAYLLEEHVVENYGTVIRRKIIDEIDKSQNYDTIMLGLAGMINGKLNYFYDESRAGATFNFPPLALCEKVSPEVSSFRNVEYFDKIALSELEDDLLTALRIIEPRIDAINFLKDNDAPSDIGENRKPFVVYSSSTERHRLSTMGDGINRILTIILAMLNCKDGILLVDEFDNGLHHSVQTKLWEIVYHLSEKLNIQVFATTHSDDCIKSFIEASKEEDGRLIRLENRGGDIVAVTYEEKDVLDYIATSNIEVR